MLSGHVKTQETNGELSPNISYDYIPMRMALKFFSIIIISQSAGKDMSDWKSHRLLLGIQNDTLENSRIFFMKLSTYFLYDPAISLLGISLIEMKIYIHTKTCFVNVYSSFTHIAKNWKQLNYPSADEWINKLWCIHAMEYYSATKRSKLLKHMTTWMILKCIISALRKKPDSKGYKLHNSIYMTFWRRQTIETGNKSVISRSGI